MAAASAEVAPTVRVPRASLMVSASCMLACDVLISVATFIVPLFTRQALDGNIAVGLYASLWPCVALFVFAMWVQGLYPGIAMSPVQELKCICIATTNAHFALFAISFFLRSEVAIYSRAVFLCSWLLSIATLFTARSLVRYYLSRKPWWGVPVIVLCRGPRARIVIEKLCATPSRGLRPVIAVIDDLESSAGDNIPTVYGFNLAPTLAKLHNIRHAIVVFSTGPRASDRTLQRLIREYLHVFPHIILMPEALVGAPLWTTSRDVGGLVGLEVNQNLLLKVPQIVKRAIDLVTTVCLSVVVIPACILIATAIRITSAGPVFFGQRRIGRNGRQFTAWKFRTMMKDADRLLIEYLDAHPEARVEWACRQKLVSDPRITRVGTLLRRMSLDELPQLWNVFLGQMSLVGPRPIVTSEVAKYGESFAYYCRVSPGLTGLWQVSGRNNTTYPERVAFDEYYVCNWSVWMDIYILLRTIRVLLTGEGAY